MKYTIYAFSLMALFLSCEPVRDDEFNLEGDLIKPTIEITAIDGNTFVVKDKTTGGFQRLWSFPGTMPANST